MAAVAGNYKSYKVGAEDGWVEVVSGAVTPFTFLRISADPHTHPFFVYTGPAAPPAGTRGIKVCHNAFKVYDQVDGISSLVYVRVVNPSDVANGKTFIDVFCTGGVLQ